MIVLRLLHLILASSLYTAPYLVTITISDQPAGVERVGGSHMYCYGYIYIIAIASI
jgi:hypothetical protein